MVEAQAILDILNDAEKLNEVSLAAFTEVDTNGNGKVDRAELFVALTSVATGFGLDAPTEEKVNEVLTALDKDQNGTLDPAEFQALVVGLLQGFHKSLTE